MKKFLNDLPNVPKAVGPYSQAAVAGGFVFLSGQIGLDPASGTLVAGGVSGQAEQVLKNIRAVLSSQGASFENVIKTTIFLTDLGDFKTVNEIYSRALGECRPARSTIQVAGLPLGAVVEIEMIAQI